MSFLEATMSGNWHLGTKWGCSESRRIQSGDWQCGSGVLLWLSEAVFYSTKTQLSSTSNWKYVFLQLWCIPMKAMKTNEDKRDRTCIPRWKQADWEVSQSPCTVGICWYHWLFLSPSDIPKSPAKTPIFSTWFLHFQSSWADASWRMEPEARWRAVSKGVNRHEISLSIIIG